MYDHWKPKATFLPHFPHEEQFTLSKRIKRKGNGVSVSIEYILKFTQPCESEK